MRRAELDAELTVLRRLTAQARTATLSAEWRSAMQQRATRAATLLRMLPRLVAGEALKRERRGDSWFVSVAGAGTSVVVLTVATASSARSTNELAAPLAVQVYRAEFVNVSLLRTLETDGLVQLVDGAVPSW
jgi:hypothetical protein